MKHILVVGRIACGKTTLLQRLHDEQIHYKKTQAIEIYGDAIDTPGEYMEHKKLFHSLSVTCADADLVLMLQDCTDTETTYFPNMTSCLPIPVIGVVTKTDLGTPEQIRLAERLLEYAGVREVFHVSSYTDEGIRELREYLEDSGTVQEPEKTPGDPV